jgi:hypothetical protein
MVPEKTVPPEEVINVRFGSLADIAAMQCDVCFTPQKQTFARVLKASRLRLYSLPEWRAAWSGGTLSQGL